MATIDFEIGRAGLRLTNQTPSARYDIPCVHWQDRDYGPSDVLTLPAAAPIAAVTGRATLERTAAQLVHGWALQQHHRDGEGGEIEAYPARTAGEVAAARLFLSQWPEGPQL